MELPIRQVGPSEVQMAPRAIGPIPAAEEGLLHILWRRRAIVIGVTAACLLAALAYLLLTAPIYESSSRLYLDSVAPANLQDSSPGAVAAAEKSDLYLRTQCQVLKSLPILSSALRPLGTNRLRTLGASLDPVLALQKALTVEAGKQDEIITVCLQSPDLGEANHIVQNVVDAYLAYSGGRTRSTTTEVLRMLQLEKQRCEAELDGKQTQLVQFQRDSSTPFLETDRSNVILDHLGKLSDALAVAQRQRIEAEADYQAAQALAVGPEGLLQLVETQQTRANSLSDDREYQSLLDDRQRFETNKIVLGQHLLPGHAVVRANDEAIARVQAQLIQKRQRWGRAYLAGLNQQQLAAQAVESKTQAAFDEQQRQLVNLGAQVAQYGRLKSDIARLDRACDVLDSRIKELNVTSDAGLLKLTLLEPAHGAIAPVAPQKLHVLGLGLVLGFMLAAATALLRDHLDRGFRSGSEIQSLLELPVLAVIPHLSGRQSVAVNAQVVRLAPLSAAAEAYRAVRTALCLGPASQQAKTILLASPLSGEGKTISASNLALALAQTRQRVLLVDADLRRPSQHQIFSLASSDCGLADVLAGQAGLAEVIQASAVPGLDILPCGRIPLNPSELLQGPAWAELLSELSARYDRIVLDASPVMPVSDARIIAASCDVALLVLRSGRSSRHSAEQACHRLWAVGARILGVIVNDVPDRRGPTELYGDYGYGDYYNRHHRLTGLQADHALAVSCTDPGATLTQSGKDGSGRRWA